MKRLMIMVVAFAVSLFFAPSISSLGTGDAWAVKPPSQDVRNKAEKEHEKEKKAHASVECKGGCPYGKDKVTGKCYKPKEGQFYLDCKTGDVKVMETKCVNLPWKPCGGSSGSTSKDKQKEKTKTKEKSKDKGKDKTGKKDQASELSKSSGRSNAAEAGSDALN